MSYCKTFGKDKVIFVTKEDHSMPSMVELPPPEPQPGIITSTGEINWSCPCLGGMATGPCGIQFRDAFSCFHFSTAETKGSECFQQFRLMQDCFQEYPSVYNKGSANVKENSHIGNLNQTTTTVEETIAGVDKNIA
ncbi:mitochondrial intermembrane space import and assembly protein 40-like [Teleopsis dalmanni]|uniref:mitochondrial intermembrane space import and assembly protein 40-like n=1 Tax=Teleopsis dalmanni TaxID=139649 RepID=UPI0018CC7DEF|nr:mitochondrial intermembrane space import and assembly protein 40-like [Teleopsis dalmanni]